MRILLLLLLTGCNGCVSTEETVCRKGFLYLEADDIKTAKPKLLKDGTPAVCPIFEKE